jgi:DNA-binding Xre family transcriptional regulator
MPAIWNLREWLKERGVTRASQVRRIIHERTGRLLSHQAVSDLLKKQPKMVRVETAQLICDAFYCCLSDFFEVKPRAASRFHGKRSCPPNLLSSKDDSIMGAVQSAGNDGQEEISSEDINVDFAGFFPNARKFSSEPSQD